MVDYDVEMAVNKLFPPQVAYGHGVYHSNINPKTAAAQGVWDKDGLQGRWHCTLLGAVISQSVVVCHGMFPQPWWMA